MIIYKTTCDINDKIYIGQDSKNDPTYLGSGLLLNRAIEKHGREHFHKELVEVCSSREELNERERFWISELDATNRVIGYNIALGGQGGYLCELCPEKLRGENYYLNRMSPDDRESHLDTFRRGVNYWKSRGFNTLDDIEAWIQDNWSGNNHSHRKNKTEEEYNDWLDTTKRGKPFFASNKIMTTDEKVEYIEQNYTGRNNPIFRNKTESEIENWLDTNRRGKNAANAKYHYTFIDSDGNTLDTDCLKSFCTDRGYNVHCLMKIIKSTSSGIPYVSRNKTYSNWKGYQEARK